MENRSEEGKKGLGHGEIHSSNQGIKTQTVYHTNDEPTKSFGHRGTGMIFLFWKVVL